jgi:hypothetical protein
LTMMGTTTMIFKNFDTCFRNMIPAHIPDMATYSASVEERVTNFWLLDF